MQKLPYQLVVGDKEKQAANVAVRTRGGEDLGADDASTLSSPASKLRRKRWARPNFRETGFRTVSAATATSRL